METFDVNYVDLGRKIKQLRTEKKMTQVQLAEQTGLTGSYIGLVERAVSKPSLETVVSIANVLGVGLNYLLSASLNNVSAERETDVTLSQRSQLRRLLTEMQQELDGWNSEK